MTVECDAVGGVNLAQGVCDTPLPKVVEDAAIQAIRDGYNIYTRLDGVAVLRQAIAEKLASQGVKVLCVSKNPDSCGAVAAAVLAAGGKAQAYSVDVADSAAVKAACEQILKDHERVAYAPSAPASSVTRHSSTKVSPSVSPCSTHRAPRRNR